VASVLLLSTVIFGLKVVRLVGVSGTVVTAVAAAGAVVLEVSFKDDNDDVLTAAAGKVSVVFKSDELKEYETLDRLMGGLVSA